MEVFPTTRFINVGLLLFLGLTGLHGFIIKCIPTKRDGLRLQQELSNYLSETSGDAQVSNSILSIAAACIEISDKISRANIDNLTGSSAQINSSGDKQKKLDLISDEIMQAHLKMDMNRNNVILYASEENDEPKIINNDGDIVIVCDPLDGSSNIDCNGITGYHISSNHLNYI